MGTMKTTLAQTGSVRKATFSINTSDMADRFTTAQLIDDKGNLPRGALITCEYRDIRFCLGGATPTSGIVGLGHILYDKQSLHLTSSSAIRSFQFINAAAGESAILQITFEY